MINNTSDLQFFNKINIPCTNNKNDDEVDFVSEIFKDSSEISIPSNEQNMNIAFSICSEFSNFQQDPWDQKQVFFCDKMKLNNEQNASTNDEMFFGNENPFNILENKEKKNNDDNKSDLFKEMSLNFDDNMSIFVENDLQINSDLLKETDQTLEKEIIFCNSPTSELNPFHNTLIQDMEHLAPTISHDFVNFQNLKKVLLHLSLIHI